MSPMLQLKLGHRPKLGCEHGRTPAGAWSGSGLPAPALVPQLRRVPFPRSPHKLSSGICEYSTTLML